VRLLNPNAYICEISDKTELVAEFRVEQGLGYVPREMPQKGPRRHRRNFCRSIFSPIRRVNYEVENMAWADRTDFNRLRIAIETDGTIGAARRLGAGD